MKLKERVESLEPLWWGLFGAGGTVAALLLPVHVFLNNIAMPLGWITPEDGRYTQAARLLQNPFVKLYLLVFLVPSLFHAAHRIKFLPHDLRVHVSPALLGTIGYPAAALLSVAAIVVVILAP